LSPGHAKSHGDVQEKKSVLIFNNNIMGYRKTLTLEEAAEKYHKRLESNRISAKKCRGKKKTEKNKKFMEIFKAKYG
jgi:hypothetical protein